MKCVLLLLLFNTLILSNMLTTAAYEDIKLANSSKNLLEIFHYLTMSVVYFLGKRINFWRMRKKLSHRFEGKQKLNQTVLCLK